MLSQIPPPQSVKHATIVASHLRTLKRAIEHQRKAFNAESRKVSLAHFLLHKCPSKIPLEWTHSYNRELPVFEERVDEISRNLEHLSKSYYRIETEEYKRRKVEMELDDAARKQVMIDIGVDVQRLEDLENARRLDVVFDVEITRLRFAIDSRLPHYFWRCNTIMRAHIELMAFRKLYKSLNIQGSDNPYHQRLERAYRKYVHGRRCVQAWKNRLLLLQKRLWEFEGMQGKQPEEEPEWVWWDGGLLSGKGNRKEIGGHGDDLQHSFQPVIQPQTGPTCIIA